MTLNRHKRVKRAKFYVVHIPYIKEEITPFRVIPMVSKMMLDSLQNPKQKIVLLASPFSRQKGVLAGRIGICCNFVI